MGAERLWQRGAALGLQKRPREQPPPMGSLTKAGGRLLCRLYRRDNISVNLYVVNRPWLFSVLWCAGVSSVTTNACQVLKEMDRPLWILVSEMAWPHAGQSCTLHLPLLPRGQAKAFRSILLARHPARASVEPVWATSALQSVPSWGARTLPRDADLLSLPCSPATPT